MPLLETQGIVKIFGKLTALDDVGFLVDQNEFHGLIGPNGSGKSTLMKCIAGAESPSAGTVHFSDHDITGLSPAERRELVALLTSLPAHMSFVLIEHDLDIALRVVERVTVMHNGRVLKTGTPDEIESDSQVQAIYMGSKH